MKKRLQKNLLIGSIAMLTFTNTKAQTISNFESLALAPDSFWNGSVAPLGTTFTDGNAIFTNFYDTAWGGFWSGGWAYSNMKDSTTAGFSNLYSARPAIGSASSANYAIGQQNAMIKLTGTASGKAVNGFYITNGTYPYMSMKDGDGFARKFGDTTGTNSGLGQGDYPDWFKLTVRKYYAGVMTNDSVEFYLADYRFSDNAQDYIIKTWEYVDLTSLGNADSLVFLLSSSDAGQWGMNTPAFFCIDNFTTSDIALTLSEIDNNGMSISLFPNPTTNSIHIIPENLKSGNADIKIIDATGKLMYSGIISTGSSQISIALLPTGIYHLIVIGNHFTANKSFIKQ